MDAIILVLGLIATGLSAALAIKFWRTKHALGRNIAYMAGGGALAGACTLVFSYSSYAGLYASLPDHLVHALRIGVFGGVTIADVLMLIRIRRIEGSEDV